MNGCDLKILKYLKFLFYFIVLFILFFETWSHLVAQAGLQLNNAPTSICRGQGLQGCTTTPSLGMTF
jgi:hypothetical protein